MSKQFTDKTRAELVESFENAPKENRDMTLKLPNGSVITFNSEQYEGIQKIRKWLKNNNVFFTLSGFAGTGKTTIIKKIIDGYYRNLVVSAPTHKAKKVIMRTTEQDGETLQSLLGLRPDVDLDNFNPNDPQFSQTGEPKMGRYRLIIIDEASMINEELFLMIKRESEFHDDVKILFMGDSAQIPPVHEKLSIVFHEESGIEDVHHLTQVMRQEDGNPLAPVYDTLRNNLLEWDGGIDRKSAMNDKGEGVVFTKSNILFRQKLKELFVTPEFRKDPDYVKLIAWRNVTVMESNEIIRKFLFGDDAEMLEVNDTLMAYRSVRSEKQFFNTIDNSADYKVMDVRDRSENEYGMFGYSVSLRETLVSGRYRYQKVFIIDHHDHANLHNYAQMHDFLKEMGIANKSKWRDYYNFRRNNMVMTTITEYEDGSKRHASEVIAKDLDYGYAITGHKSQGSTYEHVLVLENDIDLNPKTKERNQIKYVALTRPSKTATVFTRLAEN